MRNLQAQQEDLVHRLEPEAVNKAIDVLATGGMQQLAVVSAAISLKRIADRLDSFYTENDGRPALHVRDLR